jgi:NADPH2 dehydrogenase
MTIYPRPMPGLVFLEYTYVHISGRSEEHQLGASSDLQVEGLAELATIIKASGALAGIQLTHAGGKSSKDLSEGQLLGPSDVAVPVKGESLDSPSPMTMQQIQHLIESFVLAAKRAAKARFDIVELHAAHGYGLNQWLSPITNKRVDEFGGSLNNRLRLITLIIQQIKLECPNLLISVRMPGQDHLEGGLSMDDGIEIAKHLESIGVDIINVSSGIGGWRRPRERNGEGYLVPEAVTIQKHILLPVIGVGGIESGEFIDGLVEDGKLQLAAVGRAILKSPAEWAKQNLKILKTELTCAQLLP